MYSGSTNILYADIYMETFQKEREELLVNNSLEREIKGTLLSNLYSSILLKQFPKSMLYFIISFYCFC